MKEDNAIVFDASSSRILSSPLNAFFHRTLSPSVEVPVKKTCK